MGRITSKNALYIPIINIEIPPSVFDSDFLAFQSSRDLK